MGGGVACECGAHGRGGLSCLVSEPLQGALLLSTLLLLLGGGLHGGQALAKHRGGHGPLRDPRHRILLGLLLLVVQIDLLGVGRRGRRGVAFRLLGPGGLLDSLRLALERRQVVARLGGAPFVAAWPTGICPPVAELLALREGGHGIHLRWGAATLLGQGLGVRLYRHLGGGHVVKGLVGKGGEHAALHPQHVPESVLVPVGHLEVVPALPVVRGPLWVLELRPVREDGPRPVHLPQLPLQRRVV
mmetsp:Transcript_2647/g.5855  ORF Transcript_2647/g.5855 Transcript_2647/m.5855 type:complete len:245 (-) Transcript_2647:610-1344(-)